MLLTVDGKEKDWPLLASIVKEAGEAQHLKVFDTSTSIPNYIRMVRVNVCDASGINLNLDKRLYLDARDTRGGPPPDDRVATTLRTWRRDVDWQPLADAIRHGFQRRWPGKFDVQFPPLSDATLPHMALPDNVRAELEAECRAAEDFGRPSLLRALNRPRWSCGLATAPGRCRPGTSPDPHQRARPRPMVTKTDPTTAR